MLGKYVYYRVDLQVMGPISVGPLCRTLSSAS